MPMVTLTSVLMSVPGGNWVPFACRDRKTLSWLRNAMVSTMLLTADRARRPAEASCMGRVQGVGSR